MNLNGGFGYNINIGEVKIIKNPNEMVWTILGSCISVIFYVRNDLALICHAQYPTQNKYNLLCSDTCPHPCFTNIKDSNRFKYVSCALEYMIEYVRKKNVPFAKVHASLIGGASVTTYRRNNKSMGELNVIKAKEILKSSRIWIKREIIGGESGITFWYDPNKNKLTYKRHNSEEVFIA